MLRGYLYIIIAATLWAMIGPVSRFVLADGVSPGEVGFFRAFFAWFFFAGQAIYIKRTRVDAKDLPLLALFGILGITVFYFANFMAVNEGGAAFASVLLYTAPAWVAVLSPLFFDDRMTLKKALAVLLTISGVAAICFLGKNGASGSITFSTLAVVSGVVSGLSYSMYYLFGKYFSGKYDAATLFMYIFPIGAAGLFPFISFSQKTPTAWAGLIFLALFSTFIANTFYYKGLTRLEPTRAVLTATIEPVVAAVFAWLIWNELFTIYGILGALLVIVAVVITVFDNS